MSGFKSTTSLISIHALREEGDVWLLPVHHPPQGISIHALREEGDFIPVPSLSKLI